MSSPAAIRPRPISPRGWATLVVVIVFVVLAGVLIGREYDAEGGSRIVTELGPSYESGLIATIEPVSVDTTRNSAVLHLSMGGQGDVLDADGRLAQNTRVVVSSFAGQVEQRFLAGTTPGQYEVTVALDGEEAGYPFDVHDTMLTVAADGFTKNSDGSFTSTGPIPMGLQGSGGVNGWDTTFTLGPTLADPAIGHIVFQRAFSTQAFAVLMLLLAGVLGMFALTVGLLVMTRRRRVEVALLSWTAAVLFALPLLRNYLPNAPPVGATIDVFYYLWVIVVTVTGNVLVILGWMGQKRDELLAEQEQHRAS